MVSMLQHSHWRSDQPSGRSGVNWSLPFVLCSHLRFSKTLAGSVLRRARLTEADLRAANFRNADMTDAVLHRAKVRDADFTGVNFTRAKLTHTKLRLLAFGHLRSVQPRQRISHGMR